MPASESAFTHPPLFMHKSSRTSTRASQPPSYAPSLVSNVEEGTEYEEIKATDELEPYNATSEDDSCRSEVHQGPNEEKEVLKKEMAYPNHWNITIEGGQQRVYLEEDDLYLLITGYRKNPIGFSVYVVLAIITVGMSALLLRWLPKWYLKLTTRVAPFSEAQFLTVENQYGQISFEKVMDVMYDGSWDAFASVGIRDTGVKSSHVKLLDYRHSRFILHPARHEFVSTSSWKDPKWRTVASLLRPVTPLQAASLVALHGSNEIRIPMPTILHLLVSEILHPFYIFQVFSILLWLVDNYYAYAAAIFIMSTTSVISTLIETRSNLKRMRDMAKFSCNVWIRRQDGKGWREVSSTELVPGDVMDVKNVDIVPCDAVMTSGECIVNESMLTGESIPVAKVPVEDWAVREMNLSRHDTPSDQARYWLFAGTRIIRAKPARRHPGANVGATVDATGERVLATVVRTGFNTTKGALVRSMLFPRPNTFKFYQDSFKFIGVLAAIAVLGFLASIAQFVRYGVPAFIIVVRALDLITVVVPPALPATMSVGVGYALRRLRDHGIYCISPPRINVSGKLNCICFDKTGTLTEEGLDVLGVVRVHAGEFMDLKETETDGLTGDDAELTMPRDNMLYAMATCHSLKLVEGALVGDPLDVKMFEHTSWVLEDDGAVSRVTDMNVNLAQEDVMLTPPSPTDPEMIRTVYGGPVSSVVRPNNARRLHLQELARISNATPGFEESELGKDTLELGLLKRFEFNAHLRRQSVLVKRLGSKDVMVFVKGAPEVMPDLCVGSSLPKNYKDTMEDYAHRGYRVLACAQRVIRDCGFEQAQQLQRDHVEKDLEFLGFIVFENRLKETTAGVIHTLHEANIRRVMITGDNILTAISVAKKCGMISTLSDVYSPRFVSGGPEDNESVLEWKNVNDGRLLDSSTMKPRCDTRISKHMYPIKEYPDMISAHGASDYTLAITGDVFRWMVDFASETQLNRMLVKGTVFARMSPDEKKELVEKLQGLGYCVGFCGDGANDCGALKAADVGISLSDAEASVAAPFTSRSTDIQCVLQVIREGRAALVTSFSCFKYMALYSMIQFVSISLLYALLSSLGDWQFLYVDLAIIVPIAVFMGQTAAYDRIHVKRPTASLMSKKVLTSLIGQIILQAVAQFFFFFYIRASKEYAPPPMDPDERNIASHENTVLFLLSSFQYILIAMVFTVGPPYRKSMFKNTMFLATVTILIAFTGYLVFWPHPSIMQFFELVSLSEMFRWLIVAGAAIYFVLALVGERWVFPWIAEKIKLAVKWNRRRRIRKYGGMMEKKLYKAVLRELR